MRKDEDTIVHDNSVTPDEARRTDESHPALLLLSGVEAGRTFRLENGPNLVGRSDDARVVLGDEGVSRQHALILVKDGVVRVEDLHSTNGTRRNGQPLEPGGEVIQEGDVLLFGHTLAARFTVTDPIVENLQRRLFDAAVQDPLTGAYNKRYLIERFDQEFAFAERHQRPLSVLIYDIDHFKLINDREGHQTGDQVLCAISDYVGGRIRKEDLHARWGGEEFVVLMRETKLENARILADRLLVGIRNLSFAGVAGSFQISVSIGITSSSVAKCASSMELFIRADKMLYRAKEAGRDRIVVDESGAAEQV